MVGHRDRIVIRAMTQDDLSAIGRLMDQLGYTIENDVLLGRFEGLSVAPDHLALVADISGNAVGFVHAHVRNALEKPLEVVTQSLAVDDRHRRRGIGRTLMASVETWARDRGVASVSLGTLTSRHDAHAF
jgi:GNAT superfamily N-acetyltransferase